MAFESWKDVNRIRQHHCDAIYFYADLKQQRFTVEENNILPDELNPENHDILGALCSSACLEEAEKKKVQNLYARIEQGMREPINMKELETRAHIKTQAGKVELMAILCYLETDENGLVAEYVGLIRPLRKQELQEREILLAFSNDKNPSIFINRIAEFQMAHPERQYAYIQFDIRKFKYINEKYGSDTGDAILNYISETLSSMCDENHLYCRLAADIFQVVTYYHSREEIIDFIEKLDEQIRKFGNVKFGLTYGVNIVPGTSTAYRKNGDEAGLARAKGKNTILNKVVFYEDTLMNTVKHAGAIEEVEEEALRKGEFQVYLQPKYWYDKNLAKIVGAEALVRWIDADGKSKSPVDFIPVFEKKWFHLQIGLLYVGNRLPIDSKMDR